MAHGQLCTLASSPRVWLSWLHRHTGRAWRPVFVDTGLRGCEQLTWNISLAKGVRSRFYLSLQIHLLDSAAAQGNPPVPMNNSSPARIGVHLLTQKVWGETWASSLLGLVAALCGISWSCAIGQREGWQSCCPSCKRDLPEIPLTITHKLGFFFQGNGFYLLWILPTEKLLTKTK